MHIPTLLASLAVPLLAASQSAGPPGYYTGFSTLPGNNSFSFGKHYAVLNLDLINGIVGAVASTPQGAAFINSTATWIDAVHCQQPPPISIFTRIYSLNAKHPEIAGPFATVFASLGRATAADNATALYPAFTVKADYDLVLDKTRYAAGFGNPLEQILRAQKIDTVVMSGIRTSGVIMSTAYELFDMDYNIFVIGENVIETPPNGLEVDKAIKTGALPKLPANVITLDQAIAALGRSGPVVY